MKKNKKNIFWFSSFLLFFLIVIPLSQSFIFQADKKGKININKEIDLPYIKTNKKAILVFFGYFACADVCTPVLEDLSTFYNSSEFMDLKYEIDLYFVNLLPSVKKFEPDLFAKAFNNNFIGVYLSNKEIMKIDRSFNLFFAQSLQSEYEIDHTDNLYLIEIKEDKNILKSSYFTNSLNKKLLLEDIKKLISPDDI